MNGILDRIFGSNVKGRILGRIVVTELWLCVMFITNGYINYAYKDQFKSVFGEHVGLYLTILGIVIIVPFSYIMARNYLNEFIIEPLQKLTQDANDISLGQMDRKLETDRTDEIGMLINSFERMRVSLKKAMEIMAKQ